MKINERNFSRTGGRASKEGATKLMEKAIASVKKLTDRLDVEVDWEDRWWYSAPPIYVRTDYGQGMLAQMPGCCGMAVANGLIGWDEPKLREIFETMARALKYGAIVWTHVSNRFPDTIGGYTRDFEFLNPKSSNVVFLEHKNL